MYFSRQPPPERAVTALRSLHFSLNTPVVAIENLAVGPARAAIAVQDLGSGRASLMLVVRSQRTGQLACFSHDEALESEASTQIALDGALSFAEGMGFLFDDDAIPELGADGPRDAADTWNDLLGLSLAETTAPAPAEAALAEAAPAATRDDAAVDADHADDDVLETDGDEGLDDELEVDPLPGEGEAASELWLDELAPVAAPADSPPAAQAAPLLLTKFRRTASAGQGARRNGMPNRPLSHF